MRTLDILMNVNHLITMISGITGITLNLANKEFIINMRFASTTFSMDINSHC